GIPQGLPSDVSTLAPPPPAPLLKSLKPDSIADVVPAAASDQPAHPLRVKPDDALAISNMHVAGARPQQRAGVQLSPLAESHEGPGSAVSTAEDQDSASAAAIIETSPQPPHSPSLMQCPPVATPQPRSRTGSLGTLPAAHLYPQSVYGAGPGAALSGAMPHHHSHIAPWPRPMGVVGSRMSKTICPDDMDDSISDRSSISESLSIRYQPTKASPAANFPSLNRGALGTHGSTARTAARSSAGSAPLGGLLARGSYKFARIQFTLPPITEMSPVSSVYLDFEYVVDISMSIGGSFGTTKRALGRIPLKIATVRSAAKPGSLGAACSTEMGSQALTDLTASSYSLRDSMSCLNLSIAQSDDAPGSGFSSNGSPANTLTEVHFEAPGAAHGDSRLVDGSYPCLLSFIQNGEKVPAPALEFINIGTKLI
ncbi:hypothetical protein IWQ56_002804, partial [Coemansia nantahalensis]